MGQIDRGRVKTPQNFPTGRAQQKAALEAAGWLAAKGVSILWTPFTVPQSRLLIGDPHRSYLE